MENSKLKITVLVDTNVLIKASMQDDERDNMQEIFEYSKEGLINLLVSEIAVDEMQKYDKTFEDSINREIGKISSGIRKVFEEEKIWNELKDLEKHTIDSLYEYKGKKMNLYIAFLKEFKKLSEDENIQIIKPNIEKFYETQRKITKGEMARINSNDIHLIDCIEEICKKIQDEDVCFVTENRKDFFEKNDNGEFIKNENGTYKIKGLEFNFLHGFMNVVHLINYIKKKQKEGE